MKQREFLERLLGGECFINRDGNRMIKMSHDDILIMWVQSDGSDGEWVKTEIFEEFDKSVIR